MHIELKFEFVAPSYVQTIEDWAWFWNVRQLLMIARPGQTPMPPNRKVHEVYARLLGFGIDLIITHDTTEDASHG